MQFKRVVLLYVNYISINLTLKSQFTSGSLSRLIHYCMHSFLSAFRNTWEKSLRITQLVSLLSKRKGFEGDLSELDHKILNNLSLSKISGVGDRRCLKIYVNTNIPTHNILEIHNYLSKLS